MLVSMQPTYPHVDVQTVMTEIIIIVSKKGKVERFVFLYWVPTFSFGSAISFQYDGTKFNKTSNFVSFVKF